MKKKLYLTMIAGIMSMGLSMAQAQNPECMTNLSIYAEHAKVKNYDAAYEPWKMVYESCPDINKANFSYGEKILKHKIKNSSGADKDGFIQDLMELYDNSSKYFAAKYPKGVVNTKKSLLMYDNKMASDDDLYNMLGEAFQEDRKNFKNPKALYLYFSTLVDMHNAGKKDLQEVFDVYDDVTEKVEELQLVGTFDNTVDAVSTITRQKPDIILLDINISGLEGPEMMELVEYQPKVVVISSHPEEIMSQYDIDYFAFIQKPLIESEVLIKVLRDCLASLQGQSL